MFKFRDLIFFIFAGFMLGWNGHALRESYKDGRRYTADEIQHRETVACATGVVETIDFIVLKGRDEPANCDFSKR